MNPLLHIRKNVLKVTQAELAAITGARQATISRWEQGKLEPSLDELKRIRSFASERGISWDDSWFFTAPLATEVAA